MGGVLHDRFLQGLCTLTNLTHLDINLWSPYDVVPTLRYDVAPRAEPIPFSTALAAPTALTHLQIPYLSPEDQQTLPASLQQLRMVDGCTCTPAPLRLGHLTALASLVFSNSEQRRHNPSMPHSYRLTQGSDLPESLEAFEAHTVLSSTPLLLLPRLKRLTVYEVEDNEGALVCPPHELLALSKVSSLTLLQLGSPKPHEERWVPPLRLSAGNMARDVPVLQPPLPHQLQVWALEVKQPQTGPVLGQAGLDGLVRLTGLTWLELQGHAVVLDCPLHSVGDISLLDSVQPVVDWERFVKGSPDMGIVHMPTAAELRALAEAKWGRLWDVSPQELAAVLQRLQHLDYLHMANMRLCKEHDRDQFAVGADMLPLMEAVAELPCLFYLTCSNMLLGPAITGLQRAMQLEDLILEGCSVDDASVCQLLQEFASSDCLRMLKLDRVAMYTTLAEHKLSLAPHLTNLSVAAITEKLVALTYLSLAGHDGPTIAAMDRFSDLRPNSEYCFSVSGADSDNLSDSSDGDTGEG